MDDIRKTAIYAHVMHVKDLLAYGASEVVVVEPEVSEVREVSKLSWYRLVEVIEAEVKMSVNASFNKVKFDDMPGSIAQDTIP
ncbi:hypothetical protein E2562_010123 [Oryza meyeriana var. granulata]|uniref:Uncharacterized protein n=1 Tax=Oryza meyeriana var. granulata TaxID=110450 RepID=A0A6G1EJ82_9ORYZ|nr:hypothetical protein E2562_010123 [Oryza meyeriana var. granulata]